MQILPLVLALVLMISILTIEKLEKFKNQTIVHNEYRTFLKENERQVFNKREKSLFGQNEKSLRQLSFRFLYDKEARKRDETITKQYRMLNMELMRVLYSETAFFKKLEKKRPHFLEEMLTAIEHAADEAPEKMIRRIHDIAKLDLDDPELQEAFYRMLKGTISRKNLEEKKDNEEKKESLIDKEKTYVSLLTFINDYGTEKNPVPKIKVQHAPRELLKAIYNNDEVVEALLLKRKELAEGQNEQASMEFETEFKDKRRPGIDERLLDFKITSNSNLSLYN